MDGTLATRRQHTGDDGMDEGAGGEDDWKPPMKTTVEINTEYKDIQLIFEARGTRVFRAKMARYGNRPVVIKMVDARRRAEFLKTLTAFERCSPEELARHIRQSVRDEVTALTRLGLNRHSNVLAMYAHFGDELSRFYIETDSCSSTLELELRRYEGALPYERVVRCFHQILRGLAFVHARGLCHKDIQPANIFINEHGVAKIADFGVSAVVPEGGVFPPSPEVNATWYRPIEIITLREFTVSVDTWAVGCMLALCLGAPVFVGETPQQRLNIIATFAQIPIELCPDARVGGDTLFVPIANYRGFDTVFADVPPVPRELLQRLLEVHPAKRISPAVASIHPTFNTTSNPQ